MKRGQHYDLWVHYYKGWARLAEDLTLSDVVPLIRDCTESDITAFELRVRVGK